MALQVSALAVGVLSSDCDCAVTSAVHASRDWNCSFSAPPSAGQTTAPGIKSVTNNIVLISSQFGRLSVRRNAPRVTGPAGLLPAHMHDHIDTARGDIPNSRPFWRRDKSGRRPAPDNAAVHRGRPEYIAKFRLIECVAPTLHAGLKGKVVVSQLLLGDRQLLS